MESLYYILETPTNTVIIDNLTYDQAIEWLQQNGIACDHIMMIQENL